MPPIDFMTCTARDVIARSLRCHPITFANALRDLATQHRHYADITHDTMAAKSAMGLYRACLAASLLDSAAEICADFNMRIVAFGVAARLQSVPRSLLADIISREEA